MTVNRIKIKINDIEKGITFPIATDFDEVGREQLIEIWERVEIQNAVNLIQDFETTSYQHETYLDDSSNPQRRLLMDFNFFDTGGAYSTDFSNVGITWPEIYRRQQTYSKSFFKMDYFDSPDPTTQRLIFTIIIPINNATKQTVLIDNTIGSLNYDGLAYLQAFGEDPTNNPLQYYDIEFANFEFGALDSINEGYYINFLKKRDIIFPDEYYVACKFFNASNGQILKMLNKDATLLTIPNLVKAQDHFYYKLTFNRDIWTYKYNEYDEDTYSGNDGVGPVCGTFGNPIKFYEYMNP